MNLRRPSAFLLAMQLLTSCSLWQSPPYESGAPVVKTIVEALPEASSTKLERKTSTIAELIDEWEGVQLGAQGSDLGFDIANRLAQLRLTLMEDELAEGETNFNEPLGTLRTLRDLAEDESVQASVDYQLARVLSMSGQQEPMLDSLTDSIATSGSHELVLEAQFRRAEVQFSRDKYKQAKFDFEAVASTPGTYRLHAFYMLSWSRFKLSDPEGALYASKEAFTLLAASEDVRYSDLKQDLLRVTILALDYLDGPETLAAMMAEVAKPSWQTDVYRALGDWYLVKQRFNDSAQTWQTFLVENPLNASAPDIAMEVIETQREAGFTDDIPELEREFIQRYGKQSDFYDLHGEEVFHRYEILLKNMLVRYAQRLHADAQQSQTALAYETTASGYALWSAN